MRPALPEVLGLEGSSLRDLNARAHINDGLSSLEKLSSGDKVIEISDWHWFVSVLQEAQHYDIFVVFDEDRMIAADCTRHMKGVGACSPHHPKCGNNVHTA